MHQPYYVDPLRGAALMPWVRLHATKGYWDMVALVERYPELRCTFNLTPVLVRQIRELADKRVRDIWQELAATPAGDLTPQMQTLVLEHFFKANWDHMIKPHGRYWSLLLKRGFQAHRTALVKAAGVFSEHDYRDLQVWFNLAWFGHEAIRTFPELAELRRKGRDFTENDKALVFGCQQQILQTVLSRYGKLQQAGQIEISTTPFYHPIMPLVYNTEFAARCMPGRELPPTFSHPEDVRAQLQLAREYHTEVFGSPPAGVWPSEGSVCPELIPILNDLGFEWMATDEENLWRSRAVIHPGGEHDRKLLFQGHRAVHDGRSVNIVFRERPLSDFVGFTASRNPASAAADHVAGNLEQIAKYVGEKPDAVCAIVLDGENAWEHFADGGESFISHFYERLTSSSRLETTTMRDYFRNNPPRTSLNTLHTGSWINGDFDIWIGDPEENRAWQLLGTTRATLQSLFGQQRISADQYRLAMEEVYAAEGSDWFWWYGGDFVTDNDIIFDELFRTHLQNVYVICGLAVPEELKLPICRPDVPLQYQRPIEFINPTIDGRITSFYEWMGAGVFDASRAMVTMYRTERFIDFVHFGFDAKNFYLRLDMNEKAGKLGQDSTITIQFLRPEKVTIRFQVGEHGKVDVLQGERILKVGDNQVAVSFGKNTEVQVSQYLLGWKAKVNVSFYVGVTVGTVEVERQPSSGSLDFESPGQDFESENWHV
jgi:alpha-amylase/alpha-mannosidase (GH57 family)